VLPAINLALRTFQFLMRISTLNTPA